MSLVNQLQINESNIAFHPSIGNSYQVNEVAKKIIALLQKNKAAEEIIEDLSKEYDVPEQELFIDVYDFISKLKIYNLI